MLQFMQVLYYALRMTEAVEMPISKKTGKPCSHESHACFIQRFLSGKWLDKQWYVHIISIILWNLCDLISNLHAVLEFTRENGIIMLSLLPHTMHRLQPLDIGFFKPLQNYYEVFAEKSCWSYRAVLNRWPVTVDVNCSLVDLDLLKSYEVLEIAMLSLSIVAFNRNCFPFDRLVHCWFQSDIDAVHRCFDGDLFCLKLSLLQSC